MTTREPDIKFVVLQDKVKAIFLETLQITDSDRLHADTELLGALPEFDSMAVVGVLTALEERFDFLIEDDEISADIFVTLGTLTKFVAEKLDG